MDKSELLTLLTKKQQQLDAMRAMWPVFVSAIEEMRADAVEALIAQESEQLRGRIKAFDAVLELPQSVDSEVRQLAQALEDHPE